MDSGCAAPALSLGGPAVQVGPPLQPLGPTGASTGLQAPTPHLLPQPSTGCLLTPSHPPLCFLMDLEGDSSGASSSAKCQPGPQLEKSKLEGRRIYACVCMRICTNMCLHACVRMCTGAYTRARVHVHGRVCTCMHIRVPACLCMSVRVHWHMHVYVCTCARVRMCVHTCRCVWHGSVEPS